MAWRDNEGFFGLTSPDTTQEHASWINKSRSVKIKTIYVIRYIFTEVKIMV